MKRIFFTIILLVSFLSTCPGIKASMKSFDNTTQKQDTISLYDAIVKRDLALVEKMISKETINNLLNVPLYSGHSHGWYGDGTPGTWEEVFTGKGTLLHLAVFYSNEENMADIIKLLLTSGADPNIKDEDGRIPLQMGLNHGISGERRIPEHIVKILIENGSDVNFNNEERRYMSLLRTYIIQHNLEMARLIIDHGADLTGRAVAYALYSAAHSDSDKFVRLLLEKGVDPNLPLDSYYPLCMAARYSKNDLTVKALVEYGADVNIVEHVLWCAVSGGNSDALRYLVKQGANLNPRANCPAEKAVELDRLEDLKYLIEHGAEVNPKPFGSLLKNACSLEVVKYLVEKGANLDNKSVSILMKRSKEAGKKDIVKYLKSKGL